MTGNRMSELISLIVKIVKLYRPHAPDDLRFLMPAAAIAFKCDNSFINREVDSDELAKLILADQCCATNEELFDLETNILMIIQYAEALDSHLKQFFFQHKGGMNHFFDP